MNISLVCLFSIVNLIKTIYKKVVCFKTDIQFKKLYVIKISSCISSTRKFVFGLWNLGYNFNMHDVLNNEHNLLVLAYMYSLQ